MEELLKVDVELEGIVSGYVRTPFDEAKAVLNKNGFRIISAEENALLRIKKGRDALSKDPFISKNGNWTREGFVYVPQKGSVFLVRHSPILDDPEKATSRHKIEREYYIGAEQIDQTLEDSIQIPYNLKPIPVNRFGDEEVTVYLFGDNAKDYGDFLRDGGKKGMHIGLVGKDYVYDQKEAFVREMWFSEDFFGTFKPIIYGNFRSINIFGCVRGIKDTKGTTQKPKKKLIYINPFEVEYKD